MKMTNTTLPLGGFPIAVMRSDELLVPIEELLNSREQLALFFANTNFIVKCRPLLPQILSDNCLLINDGVGLDIAARLIHGKKFPENLNGSDFLPSLLQQLNHKARVFLLGAKPGIAVAAAQTLMRKQGVQVVGTADGYAQAADTEALLAHINSSNANILLVAMGNPTQEHWILQHRHQLNVNVLIGVGAFLDFLAGDKPRAPKLIRRLRLEWLYRLCLEPSRLLRRYTLDIAIFLAICIRAGKEPETLSP